jgi:pyruvate dehydrogenase E2 component (dihydrolipoamide acetyltransferase)
MLTEIKLPELGEKIEGADVANVLVHEGEMVHKDEPLAELESEKAFMEFPSPVEGVVREVKIHSGEKIKIGDTLFVIDSASSEEELKSIDLPSMESGFSPEAVEHKPVEKPVEKPAAVAPLSQRMAREMGIDIRKVQGSGPRGFITKNDVVNFANQTDESAFKEIQDLPDFSLYGPIQKEAMNAVRKATAKNVSLSVKTIPHVTQFDEADLTDLEEYRKKLKSLKNNSITVTAFLLKITAMTLKNFKYLNASIDMSSHEIIFKDFINVGIAVDTDRGLLLPVIKNADAKGIRELSAELNETAEKARTKKLQPEDFNGATFSITNLGSLGTSFFTPIIPWPQCGILGLGMAKPQPVWNGANFIPRLILPLSISYDHRIVDGAYAARFLGELAKSVKNPINMLL